MTTEGRVEGVFQKTDPWMQYDPDIEKAGPMAEFLYRRGLDIIRRNLWEGTIRKATFGELSEGIPSPKKHLQALLAVGLWIDEGTHWRIRNWDRWNMTHDQMKTRSEERSQAGQKGNHKRWHTEDKPKRGCPHCIQKGWVSDGNSDRSSDPNSDSSRDDNSDR